MSSQTGQNHRLATLWPLVSCRPQTELLLASQDAQSRMFATTLSCKAAYSPKAQDSCSSWNGPRSRRCCQRLHVFGPPRDPQPQKWSGVHAGVHISVWERTPFEGWKGKSKETNLLPSRQTQEACLVQLSVTQTNGVQPREDRRLKPTDRFSVTASTMTPTWPPTLHMRVPVICGLSGKPKGNHHFGGSPNTRHAHILRGCVIRRSNTSADPLKSEHPRHP